MRVSLGFAASIFAAALSTAALAASDGTPGATSTGSLDISLTIPHQVRITGLSDLTLTYAATGNITGSKSFCVNDNLAAANRGYSIKGTSNNGTGTDFRLTATGPLYLVYDVAFDDDTDASSGGSNLDHNTTNGTEFDSAAATGMGATCSTPNASIYVTITEADHQAAQAGSYSDTLTLLITAD